MRQDIGNAIDPLLYILIGIESEVIIQRIVIADYTFITDDATYD
jgi:hypothetical protein